MHDGVRMPGLTCAAPTQRPMAMELLDLLLRVTCAEGIRFYGNLVIPVLRVNPNLTLESCWGPRGRPHTCRRFTTELHPLNVDLTGQFTQAACCSVKLSGLHSSAVQMGAIDI